MPTLLIPIHDVKGECVSYQHRPDEPRRCGKTGKRIKYETLGGSRMVLDVPPAARGRLGDPRAPLFITEGVRKADSAVSKGLCCVDVLGVWNFRGTNEHGGKTALPDWEYVAFNDRQVFLVFDSDAVLKHEVHRALARLKAFLEHKRADVSVVYLPQAADGSKVGLDDYFAAGGTVDDLLGHATRELRTAGGEEADGPYAVEDGGLVYRKVTARGVEHVRLTNFEARIVTDVYEDDGTADVGRSFEIEARVPNSPYDTIRVAVPAARFASMQWVTASLGPSAVIYPGKAEHARCAVQTLSGDVQVRRVYKHTGWTKVGDGWCYLHGGGCGVCRRRVVG